MNATEAAGRVLLPENLMLAKAPPFFRRSPAIRLANACAILSGSQATVFQSESEYRTSRPACFRRSPGDRRHLDRSSPTEDSNRTHAAIGNMAEDRSIRHALSQLQYAKKALRPAADGRNTPPKSTRSGAGSAIADRPFRGPSCDARHNPETQQKCGLQRFSTTYPVSHAIHPLLCDKAR